MKLAGILLAAGIGQRFDPTGARLKLLEPTRVGPQAGLPIAAGAARNLRAVLADAYAIVRPATSDTQRQLHALLAAEGCALVVCERADEGMGASLACGVRATAGADGWIVALADMPAVRPTTIAAVCARLAHGAVTAAPRYQGARGHPVGFARACYDRLAALQGDQGARGVLRAHPPELVDVHDPGCLLDIDTPD